jgi:predicted O-linked N-acetylglucosamine transferase (SPINDLY family)
MGAVRAASARAVTQLPDDPRINFASALALEDTGEPDQALARYDTAIKLSPTFEDAFTNRGLLLVRLGRLREAERSAQEWVTRLPYSTRSQSALADVLLALGRYEEAIVQFDRMLVATPNDIPAHVRRGIALACLRRFDAAAQSFALAQAVNAAETQRYVERVTGSKDAESLLSPRSIYLWRRYIAQGSCDWSGWDEYVQQFRAAAASESATLDPALAFAAFHVPLTGPERTRIARHVARRIEQHTPLLPEEVRAAASRIRVGILSPDFREHLNAYLLLPLAELLDRSRFELHAYSLAADDGSQVRGRLRAAADCFSDLGSLDDADAAARIRRDGIDVLLDVGGHTTGARFGITARRPAKLQVSYLGFAGSLGSERVDYAVVDPIVAPPDAADEWTEALVHLPHTYYLYDFRAPVPPVAVSRRDYGLPEDAFVFCAFHKAEKITPDAFALWMEILKAAPHSVLWFMAIPEAAVTRLRSAAAVAGVSPTRLYSSPIDPRDRYLARQRLGDLLLDAVHHSAMTTACDALAAGLPMLTLKGAAMASRAGESLLRAAGMAELVAPELRTFHQRAVQLASQPGEIKRLRDQLRRDRDTQPLFDTPARVRELERALRTMHGRAMQGLAPESFHVAACA